MVPILGEVLWKRCFKQLNVYLIPNKLLEKCQSGCHSNQSTETALVNVVNDLRLSADAKNPAVLVLLDLSAAFDTIDHKILIHSLEHWVGLSGTVLEWFELYINRCHFLAYQLL